VKLDGDVFGIFFDRETVRGDPDVRALHAATSRFLLSFKTRLWARRWLPGWLKVCLRPLRGLFGWT
jgi:hypothetical protein